MSSITSVFMLILVKQSSQVNFLFNLRPKIPTSRINPCQDHGLLSCTIADVKVNVLGSQQITIPECGNLNRTSDKIQSDNMEGDVEAGPPSTSIFYENAGGCKCLFTYSDDSVLGEVTLENGRKFILEPCIAFPGCHVWKEEGTFMKKTVDLLRTGFDRSSSETEKIEKLRQMGIQDNTTLVTFTIKFYYNLNFSSTTDNVKLVVDQITALTNRGFSLSHIPIRMKVHCIEKTSTIDHFHGLKSLQEFKAYKGQVKKLLGGADSASLLVNQMGDSCGVGFIDSWRTSNTLTVNTKACALNELVVGHELGHNFGCKHDREHASTVSSYSYGYGTHSRLSFHRTIMAYPRNKYDAPLNIYSSPNLKYKGETLGSATNDCARVIKENRFAMAAVNDESEKCTR